MRICIAASAGGHLTQLLKVSDSWQSYDSFFVTTTEVVRDKLNHYRTVYIVGECNRQQPLQVLTVLYKCLRVIIKEKPDVVISTGAAPGFIVCLIGRVFRAKIVWLDSIANTDRLSLSGRMIRPFADLILSQWPEIAREHRNVEFCGQVI